MRGSTSDCTSFTRIPHRFWEQRKLGELASKRIEKNTNGIKETFTNSAEHGVVSQLDYFDHDITNDANIGNYSVVHPDDFIYNPRISAVAPCGPINRNKLDRNGVMSPLYTVFSVDDTIDKLYLEHYFKTSRWHQFMFLEGNSGARSDRFSISDSIFFEMPIQCPVLEEQELIASFFDRLDSLITLHQRKYDGCANPLFSERRISCRKPSHQNRCLRLLRPVGENVQGRRHQRRDHGQISTYAISLGKLILNSDSPIWIEPHTSSSSTDMHTAS